MPKSSFMRCKIVALLLLLNVANVSAQNYNYDSTHLSSHLEPFRRLLDEASKNIDGAFLLTLYRQKFDYTNVPNSFNEQSIGQTVDSNILKNNFSQFFYCYDELVTNDTNQILFIETNYELLNRDYLQHLKTQYEKGIRTLDKARALIEYIRALSPSYPELDDWKFSKSETIKKYINKIVELIPSLKDDNERAYVVVEYCRMLQDIDRDKFQTYILRMYLHAYHLLMIPYQKSIRGLLLTEAQDSIKYRNFILEDTTRAYTLGNIDLYISQLLEIDNPLLIGQGLYPFFKKRLFYLERAIQVFKILKDKPQFYDKYESLEYQFLSSYLEYLTSKNSKYYSKINQDRINLLENYFSKLLYPRGDSLFKRMESNLYHLLGYYFIHLKNYEYALKAFYVSLEIRLRHKVHFVAYDDGPLLVDILDLVNKMVNSNPINKENFREIVILCNQIISSRNFTDTDLERMRAIKLFGQTKMMLLDDKQNDAQKLLLARKSELFKIADSNGSIGSAVIGLVYKDLVNNNWMNWDSHNDLERQMDSFMYLIAVDSLNLDLEYNGDKYYAEKLSAIEKTENDFTWYIKTDELYDQMYALQTKVASLNIEKDSLTNTVSILNGLVTHLNYTVERYYKTIDSLSRKAERLNGSIAILDEKLRFSKKENDSLTVANSSIARQLDTSKAALDSLKARNNKLAEANELLSDENEGLSKANNTLWITLYCLSPVVIGLFIYSVTRGRKIVRQNKVLSKLENDIIERTKEAEEKDLARKLAQQQLLNDTALGHDLIELIAYIPLFVSQVKDEVASQLSNTDSINRLYQFTAGVSSYFKKYFDLKDELENTIQSELQLAKEYAEIWEKSRDVEGKVTINDKDIDHVLLEKIKIPKHNLVNFISNAFKHGSADKDKITIEVSGRKHKDGWLITIADNGSGFESLNLEKKKQNRGINLVMKQVDNFNSIESNPYLISFTPANIENKYKDAKKDGVVVTYKLVKK